MSLRVLDLFCGEGGAGYGYSLAGADVVGVDLVRQRRYPFQFFEANALTLTPAFLRLFDLIHASPPCQFGTELNNNKARHPNLIPPTRAMLLAVGIPYVIENVRAVKKHLLRPTSLFGTMFGCHMVTSGGQRFDLSRERAFEASFPLWTPPDPGARFPIANVFGGHLRARGGEYRTGGDTGRTRDFIGEDKPALARQMMGMPWASMTGMSEAVPPAYTRHIAEVFLSQAQRAAA